MMEEKNIEGWLTKLANGSANTIDFSFPSERLKTDYLTTIETRTDQEVFDLLRRFLIPSASLGTDANIYSFLMYRINNGEVRRLSQFEQRLLIYEQRAANTRPSARPPWEGITWVLDLLPYNPRDAISSINAYLEAHCQFLPDGRIHGLTDAMELIRAKYIERPRSVQDSVRLLLDESPRVLEHVVERLYFKMGYATTLTPNQKDGGYDVLAIKDQPGQRAKIHLECKRWQGNVGEPVVRGLLGVISDSKATNGICVTTSDLTSAAKAFVRRNPQLDYIAGTTLITLMNEYFGPKWYRRIEYLVRESKISGSAASSQHGQS